MRFWIRFVGAVFLAVTLAACTGATRPAATPTVESVRLGILAPLSGPAGRLGRDAVRGAELAAALVNQDQGAVRLPLAAGVGLPGLGGARVDVVTADTGGNAERAAERAVRLASQHIAGLIGTGTADAIAAASQRTDHRNLPFVVGGSSAGYLTQRGLDWFVRLGPTDRMLSEAAMSVLADRVAGRRIAVVQFGDPDSYGVAATVDGLAGEAGYQVVATRIVRPAADVTQAAQVLDRARAAGPEALVLVASTSTDAARLLAAYQELAGAAPPAVAIGEGFSATTLLAAQPARSEVFAAMAWSAQVAVRHPAGRLVAQLFEQRYQQPMNETAAGAFTATLALAQAVDQAGGVDPERVRAGLLGLAIPGRDTIMPWDGIRVAQDGQNAAAGGVIAHRTPRGLRVVYPPELATT